MKICAISDLHGDLINISPCNLLIICGDIVPLNKQTSGHKSLAWLRNKFIPWATDLPCDKVIFIAGNHDWVAEKSSGHLFEMFPKYGKITYLFHEDYEYEGLKIFGTPYCKIFYNWAFMEDDSILEEKYKDIYEGTVPVGDLLLDNGALMLFDLLERYENTQSLVNVFKYMAYRYSGTDYGVTDISQLTNLFSFPGSFSGYSSSGFWWPIGSAEITREGGKLFAKRNACDLFL